MFISDKFAPNSFELMLLPSLVCPEGLCLDMYVQVIVPLRMQVVQLFKYYKLVCILKLQLSSFDNFTTYFLLIRIDWIINQLGRIQQIIMINRQQDKNQQKLDAFDIQDKYSRGLSRTLPEYKNNSCLEISQITRSNYIVNDHLITTFNPKRTSMDLNSFIQVFRKKVRQTAIARQFQNSLEKFKSLSLNKASNTRKNGGFVGSCKKMNQLLIQNNKIDSKIKKVIISNFEFKDRKTRDKVTVLNQILERRELHHHHTITQQVRQRTRNDFRKIIKTSPSSHNQTQQRNELFIMQKDFPQHTKENPQHRLNQAQNHLKLLSISTNRPLYSIASSKRPNLMYNLNLYRKKKLLQTYKSKQKQSHHQLCGQTKYGVRQRN